jgi:hypothetical protein
MIQLLPVLTTVIGTDLVHSPRLRSTVTSCRVGSSVTGSANDPVRRAPQVQLGDDHPLFVVVRLLVSAAGPLAVPQSCVIRVILLSAIACMKFLTAASGLSLALRVPEMPGCYRRRIRRVASTGRPILAISSRGRAPKKSGAS